VYVRDILVHEATILRIVASLTTDDTHKERKTSITTVSILYVLLYVEFNTIERTSYYKQLTDKSKYNYNPT